MLLIRGVLTSLLFLSSSACYANLASTIVFEIRTTGNDNNGGCFDPSVASPGTDYSQQNAVQIAYTDLVIGTTTTQLTSAGNPFTSAHVGNCIHVLSGTGFTVGWYEVLSVAAGVATMDRSVGTASSTGGTGNLGGALGTPFTYAAQNTYTTQFKAWLKCGTYTITTGTTTANATLTWMLYGYNSSRGDRAVGCRPLITTSTNSTTMLSLSSTTYVFVVKFIDLSNTATTKAAFLTGSNNHTTALEDVTATGFLNYDLNPTAIVEYMYNSWIKNCTSSVHGGTTISGAFGTYVHTIINNNSGNVWTGSNSNGGGSVFQWWVDTIIYNNSGWAVNEAANSSGAGQYIIRNTDIISNTSGGFNLQIGDSPIFDNNIFYGNGTYGWVMQTNRNFLTMTRNNSYGGNTSGAYSVVGNYYPWGDINITGTPFTNASTGDFSLNSGVGTSLKASGFPGIFQGIATQGFVDVGAVQSTGVVKTFNYGSAR